MANPPFPPFDFDTSAIRGKFDGRLKWLALLLILVPVFFLSWLGRGIYTDYLWYSQLGYEDVFLTVLLTKVILFVVGFVFVFALLLANLFYVNKRTTGPIEAALPDDLIGVIRKLVLIG